MQRDNQGEILGVSALFSITRQQAVRGCDTADSVYRRTAASFKVVLWSVVQCMLEYVARSFGQVPFGIEEQDVDLDTS